MTLLVDRRKEMGAAPGLHALIVGIGQYLFLPDPGAPASVAQFRLTRVNGPAVSAFRLAAQLQALPPGAALVRPLKTLRLLLAPTAADRAAEPGLVNWNDPAPDLKTTRQAATDWRQDCQASDNEAALFFFAGHGLRFQGDDCLVLADFGEGATTDNMSLAQCVKRDRVMEAMSGPAQGEVAIARQQFWFVDACRNNVGDDRPGEVSPPVDLLPPRREDGRRQAIGGLASTASGAAAFAVDQGGGTSFGAALLKALRGALGEAAPWPPEDHAAPDLWPINVATLQQAIERHLGRDPRTSDQLPGLLGSSMSYPLVLFDARPTVDLRIRVRPPRLPTTIGSLLLQDPADATAQSRTLCPIDPNPKSFTAVAGHYLVDYVTDGKPGRKIWFASLASDELVL